MTLNDIKVDSEVLGNLTLDQVYKIAQKASKPGDKVTPLDRVVKFLNNQKALIQQEKEQKRQKALNEIMKD